MTPTKPKQSLDKGLAVGLTGGLACGKSTAGRMLAGWGADVLEADRVAHDLMRPGEVLFDRVVARFGRCIVADDGTIDRKVLGRLVFGNEALLAVLNELAHPPIRRYCRQWLRARLERGAKAVVVLPLLFETGETRGWNAVLCVTASREVVARRMKERGWNASETAARLAAQWPMDEKAKRADYVIENNGSWEDFHARLWTVWQTLLANKEQKCNGRKTE